MLAIVLLDDATRRNAARVAFDLRDLRAVHRYVGAGSRRLTHIGPRQVRGIVDTVAGHRDDASLAWQLLNEVELVGRLHFTVHVVDAQPGRNDFGGR